MSLSLSCSLSAVAVVRAVLGNQTLARPLLGIYMEKYYFKKVKGPSMFISALFTIAKTWTSTDEWIR